MKIKYKASFAPPQYTIHNLKKDMLDVSCNYYRIEKAITFLLQNYKHQPSLNEIAKHICVSPFHFQKIFVDWVGISPKKFIRFLTIDSLKNKIKETENMLEAAEIAGLSSQSRVHDLFISIEGMTPQQFKDKGKDLTFYYGYHPTPFGRCFIAITNQKVSTLKFIDENTTRNEFVEFSTKWKCANLVHKPEVTQPFIEKIFNPDKIHYEKLELLVLGSENQIKIWEALLKIPFGNVCSYQTLANNTGNGHAVRNVASIVGQNPISYLIPCHRIIAKDGTVGNFNHGKVRKQSMLAWELTQTNKE